MNNKQLLVILSIVAAIIFGINLSCNKVNYQGDMINWVKNRNDIPALFPKTVVDLHDRVARAQAKALQAITEIENIDDNNRSFANTAKALDEVAATSDLAIIFHTVQLLSYVSPDDALRKAAQEAAVSMEAFIVEHISNNVKLYNALKAYDARKNNEQLNPEELYFVQQSLDDFKRAGLDLPTDKQQQIIILKKELSQLSQDFENNIAQDNRTILVTHEQLAGLDTDFIQALKKDENGKYILGVDYPTYFKVMDNCTVTDTRKRLFEAFNNRAYPQNDLILKQVIEKRDELAKLLGFSSYAHLNLDDSMVKTPERAQQFLDELANRAAQKEQQEFDDLRKIRSESVTCTHDGKFNPWDTGFIKNQYKKQYFNIDEEEIANYFPMEKTVDGLLDVYRQFLGIELIKAPISDLWHPDVTLIEMYESSDNTKLVGYLLLDLYPRANKFSHACEMGIIPSVQSPDSNDKPGVALVIANFTKSTAEKPSLLNRHFVNTFFHEFGHAIHQLLGRTEMASFSGTSVKRDFVEMPSQMLEEWLWDKEILQKISGHYQTGAPLADDLIAKINQIKNFDSGYSTLRQAYLSQFSLNCYKTGADKDPKSMVRNLYKTMLPNSVFVEFNNFHASFGHLMEYGAQYYGYMWSKVYALDLFSEIKKVGLLNPVIGKKYIHDILAPGGSKDPNELLRDFLGREPSQEAFFKDLGI